MRLDRLMLAIFYGSVAFGALLMTALSTLVVWVLIFAPKD
jgi:hypothetical protein